MCVPSGHAAPPLSCGDATGDKPTDSASQEGFRSMLVMSGGEGYIDFRMGESTIWTWSFQSLRSVEYSREHLCLCLQVMKMARERRPRTPP